ncbi:MAG: helix-turn-helix domain-containing protein [Deltaproteobacteria bacterium]|nr:helix-turn-helix domain-containing protein [Deltaproteobacteria bacterium]
MDELAGIFKVDRRTVYGLRSQGLPSRRVGKELRFDPLEVAAWLKKRQRI